MLLAVGLVLGFSGVPEPAVHHEAPPPARDPAFRARRTVFGALGALSLGGFVATSAMFASPEGLPPCGAFTCVGATVQATGRINLLRTSVGFSGLAMAMFAGVGTADGARDALRDAPRREASRPLLGPNLLAAGVATVVIGTIVSAQGLHEQPHNRPLGAATMAVGTAVGVAGAYFIGYGGAYERRTMVAPQVGRGYGGLSLQGAF